MASKYRVSFVIVCLFFGLECCNHQSDQESVSVFNSPEFDQLVDMHCRARILKNERFEIADEMRNDSTEIQEQYLDSLKKTKSAESRALADSLGNIITSMTSKMSPDEKRSFNDSIEFRIERMNCKE